MSSQAANAATAGRRELQELGTVRAMIRRVVLPLPVKLERLDRVRGRRLGKDVLARVALPPFDNAAMDGYACRAAVVGAAHGSLDVSEADPICTGMPIPAGMDAIVPIERTRRSGERIEVEGPVRAGDHVRRSGEELERASVALRAGVRLTPAAIGLLAAVGVGEVPVIPRPRVAILVTGDEIVGVADELLPGQIHDADGPLLAALLEDAGAEVVAHERLRDDRSRIGRALARLAAEADLVCTTGGASVGTRDHLIDLLGTLGTVEVHQIAIRPGRPTSMGLIGETPVFVLPGNPLALLVGFEAIVRPAVRRLAGVEMLRPSCECVAGEPIDRHERLASLVPVGLSSGSPSIATAVRQRGSAMLAGAAVADGMAFVEAGPRSVEVGERLTVERWTAAED
jgi:molybdopterin molybdotransferase